MRGRIIMLCFLGLLWGMWAVVAGAMPLKQADGGARLSGYQIALREGVEVVLDQDGQRVGTFLALDNQAIKATDTVESVGDFLIRWRRTFSLKPGQMRQRVRLSMD